MSSGEAHFMKVARDRLAEVNALRAERDALLERVAKLEAVAEVAAKIANGLGFSGAGFVEDRRALNDALAAARHVTKSGVSHG